MKDFLNKFKIPTLLGLSIIFIGLFSGVFLVLREQIFLSRAAPDIKPQELKISNQTEDSFTISWQTNTPAASFVTYGQNNASEETALDDRDKTSKEKKPVPRLIHYVTIKNLTNKTKYRFQIISGKTQSEVFNTETSSPLTYGNEFTPIIGSVLNKNLPLDEGIVYLSLPGANIQSALIKQGGNFLIPLSKISRTDLSGSFPLTEEPFARLAIISGEGKAGIQFKLTAHPDPLPPIQIGEDIDLTTQESVPDFLTPVPDIYDLNGDGKINAADNAVILQNFGKKKDMNIKADLNEDGLINQKDLNLMSQKLKESN